MSVGPVSGSVPSRGSVPIALLVIFLDLLGFGVVLPALPYIAGVYGMPEGMAETFSFLSVGGGGEVAVIVGLLSLCFSLPQFVCAPIWGSLSDRIGRKPVLSMSLGGYCISWIGFALAPNLWWLLASRLFAGVSAANVSTAQAYIADVFPPEKRSKGMGLVGAAFGLGFTIGPAIGAGASKLGGWIEGSDVPSSPSSLIIHMPIYFALGLTFLAFLGAVFLLPESLPPELRGKKTQVRGKRLARLIANATRPVLGQLILAFFIVTFGFAVLEVFFSEFNRGVLELPIWINALVFSVIGVTIAVVQGGLMGRLTKKYGSWTLLKAGMVIMGLALLCMPLVHGIFMLICVSVALALGNSLCNPSLMAIISQSASASEQGATMGSAQSAAAMGRILGPLVGSALWAWGAGGIQIVEGAERNGALAAFSFGGILILLSLGAAIRARRQSRMQPDLTGADIPAATPRADPAA